MTRLIHEHQGCEGNIVDMNSFNDLIRDFRLIDILLGGDHLLGVISVPWLPLRSLIGSSSRITGMMHFHSQLAKLSLILSPITFQSSSISFPIFDVPIDSTSRAYGWSIMIFTIFVTSAWSSISHDMTTRLAQKLRKTKDALMSWSKIKFESVKR